MLHWPRTKTPADVTCGQCKRTRPYKAATGTSVRFIRLPLARDTTAERCGACQHADEHCTIFKRRVRVYDQAAGHEYNQRLTECVAAEVKP
jgi:hypothetical protein